VTGEAGRRGLGLDVVHTGQHYDYELSRVFFKELELTDPAAGLCGSVALDGQAFDPVEVVGVPGYQCLGAAG
jgi:hypothetical protein